MDSLHIFMNALWQLLFPTNDRKYFRMLAELSDIVSRGGTIFKDFIDTYEELSDQDRGQRVADIKELEHRCDELSHSIIMQLGASRVSPAHRHAIHNAASMLALIMDGISSVSKRMVLFQLEATNTEIQQFSLLVNNSCRDLNILFMNLSKPLEVRKLIIRIHGIEREADYVYNLAMADLFSSKQEAKYIIIHKDLYDALETVIDNVEFTSRIIENMIIAD